MLSKKKVLFDMALWRANPFVEDLPRLVSLNRAELDFSSLTSHQNTLDVIITHPCSKVPLYRLGDRTETKISFRPKPAVRLTCSMPQCSPSKQPFAATAKPEGA